MILFATNAEGVITMTAGAGLAKLGRVPNGSVGKKAIDLYPDNPEVLEAARKALAGERIWFRTTIHGRTFDCLYVPQLDAEKRVIGVVGACYDITRTTVPRIPGGDRFYLISVQEGQFGTVLDGWQGSTRQSAMFGQRCYSALKGRERPCKNCPALERRTEGSRTCVLATRGRAYEVVTAEFRPDETAWLHASPVDEALVTDLLRARIGLLTDDAKLSERERDVLRLMLEGVALGDVGRQLGITTRTAKFHMANVLRKLGAESRMDLLRLVFQSDATSLTDLSRPEARESPR